MATDAGMDLSQLLVWSGLVTFKQDQLTARFSLTGIEPRLLSEHSGLHLLSLVLGQRHAYVVWSSEVIYKCQEAPSINAQCRNS